jgi:hypothetical protein
VGDGNLKNVPGAGALAISSGPRVPDGFVRHIGGIEVVGGLAVEEYRIGKLVVLLNSKVSGWECDFCAFLLSPKWPIRTRQGFCGAEWGILFSRSGVAMPNL